MCYLSGRRHTRPVFKTSTVGASRTEKKKNEQKSKKINSNSSFQQNIYFRAIITNISTVKSWQLFKNMFTRYWQNVPIKVVYIKKSKNVCFFKYQFTIILAYSSSFNQTEYPPKDWFANLVIEATILVDN